MANPLVEMQKLGQSPWHDNIRRQQLTSGKLKGMIDAGDITGLTSNPTIFEQAIKSKDYDTEIAELAKAGKTSLQIFDAIAIEDIRAAADLFKPVFDRTQGNDGYVSIEVAPHFARDSTATINEAKRLWAAVDRPNVMVKIPATLEGLPAIETCLAEGLNINVTLIFSLERYDAVMNAYINGLTQRAAAGKDVNRAASVASFFVSRVDTLVDRLLDERTAANAEDVKRMADLHGKAAIANAKLAYRNFQKKFGGSAFAELKKKGARVQRPLWASTSTKNPKYQDTYYVEALLGPDSVDTMPPATIDAYRDHGKPSVQIDKELNAADKVMRELAELGIEMKAVTKQLEDEGVASFAKSFDSMIDAVEVLRKKATGA
ncbi:MAG: transaldolase [Deltaproteobacteria bacterium]|nr:transaldolase [Deltaproteobacteria bacterium]